MATRSLSLRRGSYLIFGALGALSVAAWVDLIWRARSTGQMGGLTMGMAVPLFLLLWVVMMVAMMFPAAAPMIGMFAQVSAEKRRRGQAYVSAALFVAVYLSLWAMAGVLAYLLAAGLDALAHGNMWLADNGGRVAGALFVAAGIYQLSPLKRVCLSKCRSPLAFVMTSWRDGYRGATLMGLEHGLYCLGCCWLLFVILLPLGMMNIGAMAAITLVIFVEKTSRIGMIAARAAAVGLAVFGLAAIVAPGLLPTVFTHHMPQM